MKMSGQIEKPGELLLELDVMLKHRYHQSLDEVLHELYIHDVIPTMNLDVGQIVAVFQTIASLKEITANIIGRHYGHRN